MHTVRSITALSAKALKYGTVLASGAAGATLVVSQWDGIQASIQTKVVEPARRAFAQAEQFMVNYQALLVLEAKTHKERRRLDNLEREKYSPVDFGEGLFVAEEYNPASQAWAAEHQQRMAQRKAEAEPVTSGKR